MFLVVTGGSGSGKSAFAERQICRLEAERRIYMATMANTDAESRRRVARHRRMRQGKGFETVECPMDLKDQPVLPHAAILLECTSNLLANEMYGKERRGEDRSVSDCMEGIRHLHREAAHLVVVTNEVFSDGASYDPETLRYLANLGEINCRMAQMADAVCRVVCGIPVWIKGEEALGWT